MIDTRNINWPLFEQHASVEAIDAHLQAVESELLRVRSLRRRLERLRDERSRQIAAGGWPAGRSEELTR